MASPLLVPLRRELVELRRATLRGDRHEATAAFKRLELEIDELEATLEGGAAAPPGEAIAEREELLADAAVGRLAKAGARLLWRGIAGRRA